MKAQDLFSLEGRRALITGGSRGIAAAIAEAFALNGAIVGLNYSAAADEAAGRPDAARRLQHRLGQLGGEVVLIEQDLSGAGAARDLAAAMDETVGPPDILVLSASVQVHREFLAMTDEATMRQIRLNLLTPIELLQAVLPGMRSRGYGRVLTLGSVQEEAPSPDMPLYAATKAAQANLVRNLAVGMAPHGITINNLSPGLIETDRNAFRRTDPSHWLQSVRTANPMGRAGQPADLAGAALYLCSDAASFVTGATLFVTGGAHIPHTPAADPPVVTTGASAPMGT
ncbi:MAG TPA: SDR family oxidoreductase [Devosia sp.]|nr:SDR family oxidoreductase [Devosia sp.]